MSDYVEKRGQVNHYLCKACRMPTVTINADDGVTPITIRCRATEDCNGEAVSQVYRVPQDTRSAQWAWYRPVIGSLTDPATREHVENGGLLLRRRNSYEYGPRLRHG